MKTIGPDFIDRGASRVTSDNVKSVVDNADAIRARFAAGAPLRRLLADASLLISLVRDYWLGRYRQVPFWAIGASVFALLYVFAPLDLVPDVVPFLGVVNDAAVFSVCLALVKHELARYAAWKAGVAPKAPGT